MKKINLTKQLLIVIKQNNEIQYTFHKLIKARTEIK